MSLSSLSWNKLAHPNTEMAKAVPAFLWDDEQLLLTFFIPRFTGVGVFLRSVLSLDRFLTTGRSPAEQSHGLLLAHSTS